MKRVVTCELSACVHATVFLTDVEPLFWFAAHQSMANQLSGGGAGAAQAKLVKGVRTCWKTKFPREYTVAEHRVGLYTTEFTVEKLKTMSKDAGSVAFATLVKEIHDLLTDEWRTVQLKNAARPEWTAAYSFVKNSLQRWRLKKVQGSSLTSKHTISGGERYNPSVHFKEVLSMYKAGTLVTDITFKIRVGQVCLLVSYS